MQHVIAGQNGLESVIFNEVIDRSLLSVEFVSDHGDICRWSLDRVGAKQLLEGRIPIEEAVESGEILEFNDETYPEGEFSLQIMKIEGNVSFNIIVEHPDEELIIDGQLTQDNWQLFTSQIREYFFL